MQYKSVGSFLSAFAILQNKVVVKSVEGRQHKKIILIKWKIC